MPRRLTPAWKVAGKAGIVLAHVRLNRLAIALKRSDEQLGKTGDGPSAKDHIDVLHVLTDVFAIPLGNTASDGNEPTPARRHRSAHHSRNLAVEMGIRLLANTTSHEDDDIRLVGRGNFDTSARPEHTRNALRVMEVHLTSEGLNVIRKTSKRTRSFHYATTDPAPCSMQVASAGVSL